MKVGHCPYKPGALRSKVDNFNFTELAGIWKVVYDENSMKENFTCPGVRFDFYDNNPSDHKSDFENNFLKSNEVKIMHLRQSYGLTSEFRQTLIDHDTLAAHDPYIL